MAATLEELLEICVPEEEEVVRRCFERELPRPIVGFEMKVGSSIVAEFSLAWPELKVGVPLEAGSADAAGTEGWTLRNYAHVLSLVGSRSFDEVE